MQTEAEPGTERWERQGLAVGRAGDYEQVWGGGWEQWGAGCEKDSGWCEQRWGWEFISLSSQMVEEPKRGLNRDCVGDSLEFLIEWATGWTLSEGPVASRGWVEGGDNGWQPGGCPWEQARLLLAVYCTLSQLNSFCFFFILIWAIIFWKASVAFQVCCWEVDGSLGLYKLSKTSLSVWSSQRMSKGWNYGGTFFFMSNYVLCVWGKWCLKRGLCDSPANSWDHCADTCLGGWTKDAEIGFTCPLLQVPTTSRPLTVWFVALLLLAV